jgi:hypothetical protein
MTITRRASIDLKPFCSTDKDRPNLHRPWSRGDWTWATNGHILIRVPRRADVPENDEAPDPSKILAPFDGTKLAARAPIELPAVTMDECDDCSGAGYGIHGCPYCECDCGTCGGTGKVDSDRQVSIDFCGGVFALRYVRQIMALPGLRLPADHPDKHAPLLFAFDGGVGALMGLSSRHLEHISPKAA